MSDDSPLDPGQPGPAAADAPEPAEDTATALADLKRDRDDLYDRLLRKTAEFDNYRRRIERERRELQDLLLVVDDFDRALTADSGVEPGSYRKGVGLIHTELNDLLRKYKVTPFDAVGADFDPNVHQAVVHEMSPEHREGEVISELRRGYMMGDKLLRPAMVKVAKA